MYTVVMLLQIKGLRCCDYPPPPSNTSKNKTNYNDLPWVVVGLNLIIYLPYFYLLHYMLILNT